MKNKTVLIIMGVILFGFIMFYLITREKKLDIEGYWCNYNATASIVVTLKSDYTKNQKKSLEGAIQEIIGLESYDFLEEETLISDNGEALDTYFVYFNSAADLNSIIEMLKKEEGVYDVKENNLKSNLRLFYLKDGKYKLYDSLYSAPVLEGTYTKEDKYIKLENGGELYISTDFICSDEKCTTIYSKTNEFCE